jgi:hypothetical protein
MCREAHRRVVRGGREEGREGEVLPPPLPRRKEEDEEGLGGCSVSSRNWIPGGRREAGRWWKRER